MALEFDLQKLFNILKTGSTAEIKAAKKSIEKAWHKEPKSFKKYGDDILRLISEFDAIQNSSNQAAVASGLSLFFLSLADDHFEPLKNFVIKTIQHPHGHVREAIRKTACWLHSSLTSRARPWVWPKNKPLTPKQEKSRDIATRQYLSFIKELEDLVDRYDDGTSETTEYVDDMPPSIFKSIELLHADMTRGRTYRQLLYEESNKNASSNIRAKRKEIEQDFINMLSETESDVDLDDVLDAIFEEEGTGDMAHIVGMFDRGGGADDFEAVIDLITDAWNYFPHRSLAGLCPKEMRDMHSAHTPHTAKREEFTA